MSSKRGRKRNDSLPPNRARDVQRAFRARRAAHLQALEQRVAELEEENDVLRLALHMPPSQRLPLGKGPTGKDKAKPPDTSHSLPFSSSRESSTVESPPSRETSASPTGIPVSMSHNSHPMTVIDPNDWNDSMLMNEAHHHHPESSTDAGSSDMPYHISPIPAPLSAPLAPRPLVYPYDQNFASSSRSVPLYSGTPAPSYSSGSVRAGGSSYGGSGFQMRGDMREEQPRTHYSYAHHAFVAQNSAMHSQSPSPSINHNTHHQSHTAHDQNQYPPSRRQSPLPYNVQRRSLPDIQGLANLGQEYPHLPSPSHLPPNSRSSEYLREQDQLHHHPGLSRYDSTGRLNMS